MHSDAALQLAERAARAGGEILAERFRGVRTLVASKTSSTDMVTDADKASELAILEVLREQRPEDAVLGEESGATEGSSGLRWIVDPLDGTTNFLYGIAQFAVSVAVEDERGGLAGCVFDPIRNECFTAGRDIGAWCDGRDIDVTNQDDLSRALVATGFSYLSQERATAGRMLPTILPAVRDLRRPGSAALDLAWVAAGRLDGYFEAPVFPWDGAAGVILVREAGGRVGPMPAIGPSGVGVIASAPGIFDALEDLVAIAAMAAGVADV